MWDNDADGVVDDGDEGLNDGNEDGDEDKEDEDVTTLDICQQVLATWEKLFSSPSWKLPTTDHQPFYNWTEMMIMIVGITWVQNALQN